ncbi:MAG: DoxX family protein [Prochlorococcus marinus CUG1438]|nr:DoxX family protein [Prochlorococcus marinus CUG1438]
MKIFIFKSKSIKSFLDFLSRVSISAIFISAIPSKINGFERTVEYISSKGIPDPIASILLVGAIICLILGSGFFIFGENQKIGSVFLLIFLIPTTIIFHVFPFNLRPVLMNLGLIGGLIITALREKI